MNEDLIMYLLKQLGCQGIILTDEEGIILRAEEDFFCEMMCGEEKKLVGKSIYLLEKDRVFFPSITVKIIEEKKKMIFAAAAHPVAGGRCLLPAPT